MMFQLRKMLFSAGVAGGSEAPRGAGKQRASHHRRGSGVFSFSSSFSLATWRFVRQRSDLTSARALGEGGGGGGG